jgi:hypothetical protein
MKNEAPGGGRGGGRQGSQAQPTSAPTPSSPPPPPTLSNQPLFAGQVFYFTDIPTTSTKLTKLRLKHFGHNKSGLAGGVIQLLKTSTRPKLDLLLLHHMYEHWP